MFINIPLLEFLPYITYVMRLILLFFFFIRMKNNVCVCVLTTNQYKQDEPNQRAFYGISCVPLLFQCFFLAAYKYSHSHRRKTKTFIPIFSWKNCNMKYKIIMNTQKYITCIYSSVGFLLCTTNNNDINS